MYVHLSQLTMGNNVRVLVLAFLIRLFIFNTLLLLTCVFDGIPNINSTVLMVSLNKCYTSYCEQYDGRLASAVSFGGNCNASPDVKVVFKFIKNNECYKDSSKVKEVRNICY